MLAAEREVAEYRSAVSTSVARVVVYDFDGTVSVGDAPAREYLRGIAGNRADQLFAAWDAAGRPGLDGYAMVADWARANGVSQTDRSHAYAASRAALHDGRIATQAPAGLADLLHIRPDPVRCVLVTNAPIDGIGPALERMGLGGCFDELIGDAGKPAGLPALLRQVLGGLPAERLLSVGDLWANDLAPAAAIGAATALVDPQGTGNGSPTYRACTLTALLPDIERWWTWAS